MECKEGHYKNNIVIQYKNCQWKKNEDKRWINNLFTYYLVIIIINNKHSHKKNSNFHKKNLTFGKPGRLSGPETLPWKPCERLQRSIDK